MCYAHKKTKDRKPCSDCKMHWIRDNYTRCEACGALHESRKHHKKVKEAAASAKAEIEMLRSNLKELLQAKPQQPQVLQPEPTGDNV